MAVRTEYKAFKGIRNSPWLLVGSVLILLVIVLVLAVQNINREKRYMSRILSEKGAALIKAFEAGARSGIMSSIRGGGNQIQRLLEETARQPDVLYLIIIDETGTITAHNDRTRIGERIFDEASLGDLKPGEELQWRVRDLENGIRSFEVFRHFKILSRTGLRSQRNAMVSQEMDRETGRDMDDNDLRNIRIIFIGLEIAPFEEARKVDIRNTFIISAILLLLGFGGFLSLFWAQSYRSARRSFQDASAFADEIVSSLPVGLIATGRDGKIAFFNGSAGKITGIDLNDAAGKAPDELFEAGMCDLIRRLNEGEIILEREMECEFHDQGVVPISVSATRIVNDEGHVIGNALIMRDLTEVRMLQEKIRKKEKLAALGALAAGVAHEIRNPLSSIKGMATYFGSKFLEGSGDREAADVMVREVDRLDRVISELLYYARPSELKINETDINRLLEHSIRLVRQDAQANNIEILLQEGKYLPKVFVDPDRFSQCLLNLYLNAIQAMDKGGVLSVRAFYNEKEMIVEVEDNGEGIGQDDLEKIFDPYFTTKPSGTGLGLAIVHKIIEAHFGRITVTSSPGRGTLFSIFIPIKKELPRKNKELH